MSRTPLFVGMLLAGMLVAPSAEQAPASAPARPAQAPTTGPTTGLPSRDTRAAQTGRARIRGRVTVAGTGQPARRATVRLSSTNSPSGRMTTTDLEGRYEFASLPAGDYSLQVSKTGFLSLSYGQTRTTMPPKRLPMTDGQVADGIDLLLLRGGAIAGRVVDEFGDPVAGVVVAPLMQQFQAGRMRLVQNGPQATTNDLGEYRLSALTPRTYFVMAFVRPAPTMMINGQPVTSDDQTGFAPVFYPGTSDSAGAAKIAVASGQTATEINFALTGTRLNRIAGIALDAQGAPLGAGNVTAIPRSGIQNPTYSAQMSADGSFVISGVPPGEYTLRANARPAAVGMQTQAVLVSGGDAITLTGGIPGGIVGGVVGGLVAAPPPPPPSPGSGPQTFLPPPAPSIGVVSVNGTDVSGVVLVPVRKIAVRGRVIFDSRSTEPPPDAARIRIVSQLLNPEDQQLGIQTGPGGPPPTVKDDFTFEISVVPALTMLRPNIMPQGRTPNPWVMRALRVNGVDRMDTGIDIHPGDNLDGIEIELTTRPAEIAGTVAAAQNVPAANHAVFIFPQDRELWTTPGPDRVLQLRSDDQGHFTTRNVRPGRYYVVALAEIDPGTVRDPDVLQTLVPLSLSFSVDDGEKKTIQIKPSVLP